MRPLDGDLLGAASLLVGTAGLLYSTWYKEFTDAQQVQIKPKSADRGPARRQVRHALLWRSLPLTAATGALVLVFAPVIVDIFRSLEGYDPVQAAFLVTYAITVMLAVVAARITLRLNTLRRRLDAPDRW